MDISVALSVQFDLQHKCLNTKTGFRIGFAYRILCLMETIEVFYFQIYPYNCEQGDGHTALF